MCRSGSFELSACGNIRPGRRQRSGCGRPLGSTVHAVASNLACVGLAVADSAELGRLLRDVVPLSRSLGIADGIEVRRWDDESGARLLFGLRGDDVVDFVPSYAAGPTALLSSIDVGGEGVATAAVVDRAGEQLTSLAIELEEWRFLRLEPRERPVAASVIGLGIDVSLFENEADFDASPSSLLSKEGADEPPPAHYVERGWKWPPRVGPESFISYGVFGTGPPRKPHARLAGTVLEAEVRTVTQTSQSFVWTRVRTVGFEAHVCFPSREPTPPRIGSILHGTVYLVGSVVDASLDPGPGQRSRWFRRSRRS